MRTRHLPAHFAARRLGIRLISPDRPGVGDSTIVMERRTLDWTGDVAVLMNSLGIHGWRLRLVLGGQYALALGRGPERVSAGCGGRLSADESGPGRRSEPPIARFSDRVAIIQQSRARCSG